MLSDTNYFTKVNFDTYLKELAKFEKEYPNVLNGDNLQNIIESLKARRNDNELVDK